MLLNFSDIYRFQRYRHSGLSVKSRYIIRSCNFFTVKCHYCCITATEFISILCFKTYTVHIFLAAFKLCKLLCCRSIHILVRIPESNGFKRSVGVLLHLFPIFVCYLIIVFKLAACYRCCDRLIPIVVRQRSTAYFNLIDNSVTLYGRRHFNEVRHIKSIVIIITAVIKIIGFSVYCYSHIVRILTEKVIYPDRYGIIICLSLFKFS